MRKVVDGRDVGRLVSDCVGGYGKSLTEWTDTACQRRKGLMRHGQSLTDGYGVNRTVE